MVTQSDFNSILRFIPYTRYSPRIMLGSNLKFTIIIRGLYGHLNWKLDFIENQMSDPDLVFHYTTQEGFLGIMDSSSIWATHCRYLNDKSELMTAIQLAINLYEIRKASLSDTIRGRIEMSLDALYNIVDINHCLVSFCENGDDLGQWRAYAGGIGGFSLGFRKQYLSQIDGFVFRQCIYERFEQEKQMNRMYDRFILEYANNGALWCQEEERHGIGQFIRLFLSIALTFKSNAFRDEKEWRLISDIPISSEKLDVRPGKSNLVPFFKLAITSFDQALKDVYIGPSPNPKLSAAPVGIVLAKKNIPFSIMPTSIPYREW